MTLIVVSMKGAAHFFTYVKYIFHLAGDELINDFSMKIAVRHTYIISKAQNDSNESSDVSQNLLMPLVFNKNTSS